MLRQSIFGAWLLCVGLLACSRTAMADLRYSAQFSNPEAVQAVERGELTEASAAWWGFDPQDATIAIQQAIDSRARRIVIPYMGTPWIVKPIRMKGDLTLVFEPGVVVLAKKGEFLGGGDSLFRAQDVSNITALGYGAVLRMHKRDYQQPPYKRAEWRMGLSFNGCSKIHVEGVRIESSGGDGIYLGTTSVQEYCKDVVIRNVVCHDNHRQGISVIGAENLLIENSLMSGTWGTAPGAGIDLEPDSPKQRLVNIVIRNCTFENNEGHEMMTYLKNLDQSTPPVSIRVENCLMRKTTLDIVKGGIGRSDDNHGWAGISVGACRDDGPSGLIEFVGCTVDGTGTENVKIYDKSAQRVQVKFRQCHFKSPWQMQHAGYADLRVPILFEIRRPHLSKNVGGVEFVDCHLWDHGRRSASVALSPFNSELGLHDVRGEIFVHSEQEPRMWIGSASQGVSLQLKQVKPTTRPGTSKPNADGD